MAIVVDPDLLDRFEVIYNTSEQRLSFYPVGSAVTVPSALNPDGIRASGIASATGLIFRDATRTGTSAFGACQVTAGDILCLFNGSNAGHYIIDAVTSASQLTVRAFDNFAAFVAGADAASNIYYTVRSDGGVGGTGSSTAADGATEQALYSFSKEEWRDDQFNTSVLGSQSTVPASDDLIKHEFPFEAITAEQFEIGGGQAHGKWTWGDGVASTNTTVHYVRTGGWADKSALNAVNNEEYTGIITLGTIDADAQVYFQQANASAAPVDFVLTGAVNQAVQTVNTSASFDERTFLKLFVRKKARTYTQSDLTDIGVTTIQTIVNRFPLAHATDAGIVAFDGSIVSASPFISLAEPIIVKSLTGSILALASTQAGGSLLHPTATFIADDVRPGDTAIVSGSGFTGSLPYHIIDVPSETTLVMSVADGNWVTNSTGEIQVRVATPDKISITLGSEVGILISTAGSQLATFRGSAISMSALNISAGDFLVITASSLEAAPASSDFGGVYKIESVPSTSLLSINKSAQFFDQEWPTTSTFDLSFRVEKPHMILQQKADIVTSSSDNNVGDITFASNSGSSTIVRTVGDWESDGVTKGDVIQIVGTVLNNSCFTVASATTTKLTITAGDSVTNEGPFSSNAGFNSLVTRHFARSIGGETFAFRWRVFGIGALAGDVFQFVQHQLRQTTDIDIGGQFVARGDITDLLMNFTSPTGTTLNMFIDDLNVDDINNVTFRDACGKDRVFPFVATVTLQFNANLQSDDRALFWVFFTDDLAADTPQGFDYGTKDAIIVQTDASVQVIGSVAGNPTFQFSYDYTGNVQRGTGSASTDAPLTVIAIGLDTAQFVITTGTITRAKGIVISLVSALERNYSNP